MRWYRDVRYTSMHVAVRQMAGSACERNSELKIVYFNYVIAKLFR